MTVSRGAGGVRHGGGSVILAPLRAAPRHLWIVGALSLLWNAFGATDYLLTRMGNEAYLSQFTAEQQAYFTAFPFLAGVGWGLGVWGALVGFALVIVAIGVALFAYARKLAARGVLR